MKQLLWLEEQKINNPEVAEVLKDTRVYAVSEAINQEAINALEAYALKLSLVKVEEDLTITEIIWNLK